MHLKTWPTNVIRFSIYIIHEVLMQGLGQMSQVSPWVNTDSHGSRHLLLLLWLSAGAVFQRWVRPSVQWTPFVFCSFTVTRVCSIFSMFVFITEMGSETSTTTGQELLLVFESKAVIAFVFALFFLIITVMDLSVCLKIPKFPEKILF